MTIYLDGSKMKVSENTAKEISTRLEKENLVIKSLVVNDTEMINSSLEEVLESITEEKEVVIETAPALDFCMEAAKIAIDYIPRLNEGLVKLRDKVLEGNIDQVKLTVDQAIEGLEWVIISAKAAVAQSENNKAIDSLSGKLESAQPILVQLESALQEEDYTLICDLFEYEISPLLDEILEINEMIFEDQNPLN